MSHKWTQMNMDKGRNTILQIGRTLRFFFADLELRLYEFAARNTMLEIRRKILRKLLKRFTMDHHQQQQRPDYTNFYVQEAGREMAAQGDLFRQSARIGPSPRRTRSGRLLHRCRKRGAGSEGC